MSHYVAIKMAPAPSSPFPNAFQLSLKYRIIKTMTHALGLFLRLVLSIDCCLCHDVRHAVHFPLPAILYYQNISF